jgi:hypothetical protein
MNDLATTPNRALRGQVVTADRHVGVAIVNVLHRVATREVGMRRPFVCEGAQ